MFTWVYHCCSLIWQIQKINVSVLSQDSTSSDPLEDWFIFFSHHFLSILELSPATGYRKISILRVASSSSYATPPWTLLHSCISSCSILPVVVVGRHGLHCSIIYWTVRESITKVLLTITTKLQLPFSIKQSIWKKRNGQMEITKTVKLLNKDIVILRRAYTNNFSQLFGHVAALIKPSPIW